MFFVAHSYGGLAFVELVSMPSSLPSFLRSFTDFQNSFLLSSSNSSLGIALTSVHIQFSEVFFESGRSFHEPLS